MQGTAATAPKSGSRMRTTVLPTGCWTEHQSWSAGISTVLCAMNGRRPHPPRICRHTKGLPASRKLPARRTGGNDLPQSLFPFAPETKKQDFPVYGFFMASFFEKNPFLLKADKKTKKPKMFSFYAFWFFWRHHPESNRGIKVLQTSALPLGYGAIRL